MSTKVFGNPSLGSVKFIKRGTGLGGRLVLRRRAPPSPGGDSTFTFSPLIGSSVALALPSAWPETQDPYWTGALGSNKLFVVVNEAYDPSALLPGAGVAMSGWPASTFGAAGGEWGVGCLYFTEETGPGSVQAVAATSNDGSGAIPALPEGVPNYFFMFVSATTGSSANFNDDSSMYVMMAPSVYSFLAPTGTGLIEAGSITINDQTWSWDAFDPQVSLPNGWQVRGGGSLEPIGLGSGANRYTINSAKPFVIPTSGSIATAADDYIVKMKAENAQTAADPVFTFTATKGTGLASANATVTEDFEIATEEVNFEFNIWRSTDDANNSPGIQMVINTLLVTA